MWFGTYTLVFENCITSCHGNNTILHNRNGFIIKVHFLPYSSLTEPFDINKNAGLITPRDTTLSSGVALIS